MTRVDKSLRRIHTAVGRLLPCSAVLPIARELEAQIERRKSILNEMEAIRRHLGVLRLFRWRGAAESTQSAPRNIPRKQLIMGNRKIGARKSTSTGKAS